MYSFGDQIGSTCPREMPFMLPNTTITITMDASMEVWGGHCIVPWSGTALYSDLWTRDIMLAPHQYVTSSGHSA